MQPAQSSPRLTFTEAKVLEAFLTPEVTILAVAQSLKLSIQELLDALTAPAIRAAFDTLSSLDAIRRRLSLAPVVPGALAALKRLLDLNDKPAEVRRAATTILNTYTRLEFAPRARGSRVSSLAPLPAALPAPLTAPLPPPKTPLSPAPPPHAVTTRSPQRPDPAIENHARSPHAADTGAPSPFAPQPAALRTIPLPAHAPPPDLPPAFFATPSSVLSTQSSVPGPQPSRPARAARLASSAGLAAAINNSG